MSQRQVLLVLKSLFFFKFSSSIKKRGPSSSRPWPSFPRVHRTSRPSKPLASCSFCAHFFSMLSPPSSRQPHSRSAVLLITMTIWPRPWSSRTSSRSSCTRSPSRTAFTKRPPRLFSAPSPNTLPSLPRP
ncbi:unnamed protein product [Oikopleura dioica]|uniref:Secreted protein n=1 Tax=Oikopleura dioica TaxID=34765 RepID=E4Z0E7_OIKDI|nr:unnamed protein product [Oikopleura dioica]